MSSVLHPSSYRSQESGRGVANATQLASGNTSPCQSRLLSSSLAHLLCPMPPSGVSLPELSGTGLELGGRVPGVIPHEKGRGACLGM